MDTTFYEVTTTYNPLSLLFSFFFTPVILLLPLSSLWVCFTILACNVFYYAYDYKINLPKLDYLSAYLTILLFYSTTTICSVFNNYPVMLCPLSVTYSKAHVIRSCLVKCRTTQFVLESM